MLFASLFKTLSIAALAAMASSAIAVDVREIGSFHVGGREVKVAGQPNRQVTFTANAAPLEVNPNGEFEIEQMYVQYVRLAKPKMPYPVLLIHGGGLTGVTWETTPDGRPGWQSWFLNHGYDVYVSDGVERGRSGWSRENYKNEPLFRSKEEAWDLFRFGPAGSYGTRAAYPGQQFPLSAIDQFAKQSVPRWITTDAPAIDAYVAYFKKVCPCYVVAHSQGGNLANAAALRVPHLVKGLALIEPSGALDASKIDMDAAKKIPMLWVWGDYLRDSPFVFWKNQLPRIETYRRQLSDGGVSTDWYELPTMNIKGNSHMPMMDKNSDDVAALVDKWLRGKAVTSPR